MNKIKAILASSMMAAATFGASASDFSSLAYMPQIGRSASATIRTADLMGPVFTMTQQLRSIQPGPGNLGLVWQVGDNNDGQITQRGFGNVGLIRQVGMGNIASIQQFGGNHSALVHQQGRNNVAIVRQR